MCVTLSRADKTGKDKKIIGFLGQTPSKWQSWVVLRQLLYLKPLHLDFLSTITEFVSYYFPSFIF